MRTEQRTIFVARDGSEFLTEPQCRAHERKTCGEALIGLTEAQVEAARTREDAELAEAIENFGYELRKARQASGQLKRRRSPRPKPETDADLLAHAELRRPAEPKPEAPAQPDVPAGYAVDADTGELTPTDARPL
jgi:hypothetical protein